MNNLSVLTYFRMFAIHIRDDHPDTTLEEYQETYPDAPLLSEAARERIKEKKIKNE